MTTEDEEKLIHVGQELTARLPMFIPSEPTRLLPLDLKAMLKKVRDRDLKGGIVGSYQQEIEPGKSETIHVAILNRKWADGFVQFVIRAPIGVYEDLQLSAPIMGKVIKVLDNWARERESLELEFTKGELLQEIGYDRDKLKKSRGIYDYIEDVLLTWKHTELIIQKGESKHWQNYRRLELSFFDMIELKDKGAKKIRVRLNSEIFGRPGYVKMLREQVALSLPRIADAWLHYVYSMEGIPVNRISVRKLFFEKAGCTKEWLKHEGPKRLELILRSSLEKIKKAGALRKPYYRVDKKGSSNPLKWVITFYPVHRTTPKEDLVSEILSWFRKWKTLLPEHAMRVRVNSYVDKWGIEWVKGVFEWCKREGKHPKDFWREIAEGPTHEELEELEEDGNK